jgi:UDP-N-acetylmuramate--alanine ligase
LNRPVHAVFQPHRHSRLEAMLDDFSRSFSGVTSVTITDTYSAGEAPRAVNAASLAGLIAQVEAGMPVTHAPTIANVVSHLAGVAKPGDLVILLGAGDIHTVGAPLLADLEARWEINAQTA